MKSQPKEGSLANIEPMEYRLNPEDYRATLKQIELEGIDLEECSCKLRRDKLGKSLRIFIKQTVTHEVQGENLILVGFSCELFASSGAKKDFALRIICTFKLRYSSKMTLKEDFIEIFKERNVPVNTWPYFREFVQNMTQRMNIPPLTLPLLKY